MKKHLAHIALVVDDYDKAINYYTQVLKFVLKEDTKLDEQKRWVLILTSAGAETSLLLAKANNTEQLSRVGNQTGGRVFLFLYTADFDADFANLIANNVTIVRSPVNETWGKVMVFEDLYGNLWDLIEPKK